MIEVDRPLKFLKRVPTSVNPSLFLEGIFSDKEVDHAPAHNPGRDLGPELGNSEDYLVHCCDTLEREGSAVPENYLDHCYYTLEREGGAAPEDYQVRCYYTHEQEGSIALGFDYFFADCR